ncbi:polyprenyl synthetase family protein [Tengunoibacter tsumagoiensis]|uniref:Polyprenyl synthetase n=1 Tax=Tengunoibacter tsumagoiensis TaxID=2014871 RepID=A0A401ZY71_9CHLR|nr:polyprenyl synthetase family protein [Tengunoibacter tsumagoiensis]GCE11773.1 polyprenyl synthetase [Tengunoibacter tsumagoiensis]
MVSSSTIQTTLVRHQQTIDTALRTLFQETVSSAQLPALAAYYGQMQYHLGWLDADLKPTQSNPGKLLRPTLVLLAYEAAGAWGSANELSPDSTYLHRALPAAVAVELTHNFTLIHDDIEDGDIERRHRPTLWTIWGVPQSINSGDGMYALSRLALWKVLEHRVSGDIAARLATILDRTVLVVAEGQYLDISFEERQDISVSMYIDMISRKTAALMGCAVEMGALLGTQDEETIRLLRTFGDAIGVAFQVRDDILGIWATEAELGKTSAGDVYRRKKSLPILHALEHASPEDQRRLQAIYGQKSALTPEQVAEVMTIFEHTGTQAYCHQFLRHHCQLAHEALSRVPHHTSPLSRRALNDMEILIQFTEDIAS